MFIPGAFQDDPDAYLSIAKTIDRFGVFGLTSSEGVPRPIAFRPPLYPWLLASSVVNGQASHLIIAVLHLAMATFMSCAVFAATRGFVSLVGPATSESTRDRCGLVAAMLAVIDPILIRQSTEVMTETLATSLASVVILLWYWFCQTQDARENDVDGQQNQSKDLGVWVAPCVLGVTLALAYLCRPTFLVWAVLLFAAALWSDRGRRGVLRSLIVAGLVAVAVAGWTLRNQRVLGHPVWATTHGGYTLLLANNESFYRYLAEGQFGQPWDADEFLNAYQHRFEGDPREAAFWDKPWQGEPEYDATISEAEDDRLCYEAAVATIRRQPKRFVWSAVVRAGRLWSPFPHHVADRGRMSVIAVGGYYILLYLAVAVAVWKHRRVVFGNRWWAIWLLVITLTTVHCVYWSNLRMRAPAMPALAMVAVLCVVKTKQLGNATQ